MKVGLTYDLRAAYLALGYNDQETAEFDRADTIDAIEGSLQALGHATERIGNVMNLTRQLVAGKRWDMVFNIAEGLKGFGREAQVPALLEVYDIPYTFSDPLVMSLSLHKGHTKRVIRDAGIPTADFLVVEDGRQIGAVGFAPPYLVKPVAEGTGKGITPASIVARPEDLAPPCVELIDAYHQPVLVEAFLPGREFTVGLLGTGAAATAIGTIEVHLRPAAQALIYSYQNKENCEELVDYRLVDAAGDATVREAEAIALQAWRVLGCRDAGRIDIRCDARGKPQFMEVNPLAGMHPEHSDLPIICSQNGMPYQTLIEKIVASARRRMPPQ
ncbi:MAG: D-alanine--D-alanine ligase [Desulfobacteraceae bacterium]|jgi:D-alanine-D-alanine ligase|nr:D-alanine--D-alanine ligase [Desulfobacteraceae bacterium]